MTASAPTPARPRRHAGFTLIELMVALAIGLFLITVVGSLYVASRSIFFATSSAASMDENARAAFDAIGNSVRNARYDGCKGLSGTASGDIRGPNYNNTANWWQNFNQPVFGFENLTANDTNFTVPAATSAYGGTIAGTDALVLIGADLKHQATVNQSTITSATAAVITTTLAHTYVPGETLIGSDCATTAYLVADGSTVSGNNQITYSRTAYDCNIDLAGTACADVATPRTLQPGALILPVIANGYFIAKSAAGDANKGNSLWLSTTDIDLGGSSLAPVPLELVGGIENLHIEYGISNNNAINYFDANQVTNWTQVAALKVHLLLASQPDSRTASVGSNAITFNGVNYPTAANDRRIYREYVEVFSLRN